MKGRPALLLGVVAIVVACGGRAGPADAPAQLADAGDVHDATDVTCHADADCGPDGACASFGGGRRTWCCRRPQRACGAAGPCCDEADACPAGGVCPACSRSGRCREAADCCNGNCEDGACVAWRLGHSCRDDADCQTNLCDHGICKCGIFPYASTDDARCCAGASNDDANHCVAPAALPDAGPAACPDGLCTCLGSGWVFYPGRFFATDCCTGDGVQANGEITCN